MTQQTLFKYFSVGAKTQLQEEEREVHAKKRKVDEYEAFLDRQAEVSEEDSEEESEEEEEEEDSSCNDSVEDALDCIYTQSDAKREVQYGRARQSFLNGLQSAMKYVR